MANTNEQSPKAEEIVAKAEEIALKNAQEATTVHEAIKSKHSNPPPNLWEKLEPADIFAFILIFGVVLANLIQIKQQFMIPQTLLLICGYYFGRRLKYKN